jgi:hypothetical protein
MPVRLLVPKLAADADGQPLSRDAAKKLLRRVLPQGRYVIMGVPTTSSYSVGASFVQYDLIETVVAGNWEPGLIFKGPGGILRVGGQYPPQRLDRWCAKCEQYRPIADFYAAAQEPASGLQGNLLADYCLHCTPDHEPEPQMQSPGELA